MKFNWPVVLMVFATTLAMQVFAQNNSCIFCDIAAGKVEQSRVVYRDKKVVAFLSHSPQNTGHLLVVPVRHAQYFTDIPEATTCDMMRVAKRLVEAIKKTNIKAEAFRLMMNSGAAAGQSVMHAHLHIIPRYAGDSLNTAHIIAPAAELDAVAEKIRNALKQ